MPESVVAIAVGLEERREVVVVRSVRRVLVQLSLQEVRGLLLLQREAPRHSTARSQLLSTNEVRI